MARGRSRRVGPTRDSIAPWDDEELPGPPAIDWSRFAHLRRPAVRLTVAAVVVAGVWQLTHLEGSSAPAAAPSTSATRTAPVVRQGDLSAVGITPHRIDPVREHSLFSDDADGCPPSQSCRISTSSPPGVLLALRTLYPTSGDPSVRTVAVSAGTGRRLWSRSLAVRVDGHAVALQVSSIGRELDSGRLETGSDILVYTERRNGAYVVRASVTGPAPHLSTILRAAARLASDPSMVALP